jgi:hypothetical protein
MSIESRPAKWLSGFRRRRSTATAESTPPVVEAQEFVIEAHPEDAPQPSRRLPQLNLPLTPPAAAAIDDAESSVGVDVEADALLESTPAARSGWRLPRLSWASLRQSLKTGRDVAMVTAQSTAAVTRHRVQSTYSDRVKPTVQAHRWSFLSLAILTTASATTIGTVLWLLRVPPVTECAKISVLSSDSDRLYCAQQQAQSGKAEDLLAAIKLVQDWKEGHPMFLQSERALGQWTEMLLLVARERLAQNDLDGAVKLAQQIPPNSPLHAQVKEEIGFWQSERNRGQRLFEKIQTALRQQFWEEASGLLVKLGQVDDPTWQSRVPNIRKQLEDEKKAGIFLKQATEFAKTNPTDKLGQAVTMLLPINRQTFVWERAQKEINQWRDKLFKLAGDKLSSKDLAQSYALIQSYPAQLDVTDGQRDLVRLVQASTLGAQEQSKEPLLNQLWGLAMADAAVTQIKGDSPYAKQVQALRPRLAMQVEDTVQLEVARGMASFGQLSTLNLAIGHVAQIGQKRPRRIQAQTLLAEWYKDVQQIEDRPVIKQAELLARAGGLDRLRSAVALVNRIPKGRASFALAQGQKGQWVAQIQTIEDKPILNEARSVAQAGQLGKAIQIASAIRSDRALYGEAQGYIGGWAGELRAIEDRALLAKAESYANQGSLTRAIEVASQVSGGRVGGEAQASINEWSQQREEIRRTQPPEEPYVPPAEPEPAPEAVAPEPEPAPYVPPEPAYVPEPEPLAPAPSVEVPTEPVESAPVAEPAPPPL